jgi:Family of unknown function (DUF6502)
MTKQVAPPASPDRPVVQPSEKHIRLALRAAAVLMSPIVRWLLRHGVSYGSFADSLKTVFVNVAREELERGGSKVTTSALSVLSGVHRKDTRALVESGDGATAVNDGTHNIPLASKVFTRWLTDAAFRDRSGTARPLPRVGGQRSFESLCTSISTDVHPRTVLDELVRLGLVQIDENDVVVPLAAAFIPSRKLDELTALFAANIADHVAAGTHNLTMAGPKYLEQSIWADGLSADSVQHLHQVSRKAWDETFQIVVGQASERVAADAGGDENHRIRVGVYFFSEPVADSPGEAPASRTPEPAAAVRKAIAPASGKDRTRRTP